MPLHPFTPSEQSRGGSSRSPAKIAATRKNAAIASRASSAAKAEAARKNGKAGGRPRVEGGCNCTREGGGHANRCRVYRREAKRRQREKKSA